MKTNVSHVSFTGSGGDYVVAHSGEPRYMVLVNTGDTAQMFKNDSDNGKGLFPGEVFNFGVCSQIRAFNVDDGKAVACVVVLSTEAIDADA
jgi:hypothetical protein